MTRIVLLSASALALAACVLPAYKISDDAGAPGGSGGGTTAGGAGRGGATGVAGSTGVAGQAGHGGGTAGVAGSGTAGAGRGAPARPGRPASPDSPAVAVEAPAPAVAAAAPAPLAAAAAESPPRAAAAAAAPSAARVAGRRARAARTPAANWTSQLDAVWLFEGADAALGNEANGRSPYYLTGDKYQFGTKPPVLDTTSKVQGQGSLRISNGDPQAFMTTSGLPAEVGTAISFTAGGWVRPQWIASTVEQYIIGDVGQGTFAGGFQLRVDEVGTFFQGRLRALCRVGDAETSYIDVVTAAEVGPDPRVPEWVHLVCRYDNAAGTVTIFVAGTSKAAQSDPTAQLANARGPLMLGCNEGSDCDFVGNLDELFFADQALTDAQVLRLYACGIDGARCSCQGGNAAAYASCGLLSSCAALPPCNQTVTGG